MRSTMVYIILLLGLIDNSSESETHANSMRSAATMRTRQRHTFADMAKKEPSDPVLEALQQTVEQNKATSGYCLYGGLPALEGWYARIDMQTYLNRETKGMLRKVDHWEIIDKFNRRLFVSKSKANQPPTSPSEWTGVPPTIIPATSVTVCELTIRNFKQGLEKNSALHHILDSTSKPTQKKNTNVVYTPKEFGPEIPYAIFAVVVIGLCLVVGLLRFGLWRRQPAEVEMEVEPKADDELGAPPSFVRRGIVSLMDELAAAEEEDSTEVDHDDDETLLAAALDDTIDTDDPNEGTDFAFQGDDAQQRSIPIVIFNFIRRQLFHVSAFFSRMIYKYSTSTTDLSKPWLLFMMILCTDLSKHNKSTEFNPKHIFFYAIALLDLWRRLLLNSFWTLAHLGLGKLRNEEHTILSKCFYQEVMSALDFYTFIIIDGMNMVTAIGTILLVAPFVGIIRTLSRLARARLLYLMKTRPICDSRHISADEIINGYTMSQFWRAYLYRSLDHLRISLLSISLSIIVFSCIYVSQFQIFQTEYQHAPRHALALFFVRTIAFSANGAKHSILLILHQLVLFATDFTSYFWPKMHLLLVWRFFGRLAAKRLWDKQHNVISSEPGTEHYRRCTSSVKYRPHAASSVRQNGDANAVSSTKIAAYYIEHYSDLTVFVLTLIWYLSEIILSQTVVLSLNSGIALHTFSRLRSKVRFHRAWLAARRSSTGHAHNGLRLATALEIKEYDDSCVICLGSLIQENSDSAQDTSPNDARRKATRDHLPIKLPNCNHLFHLDCLRIYLSPTSAQASTAAGKASCPVCLKPITPLQASQVQQPPPPPPPQGQNGVA